MFIRDDRGRVYLGHTGKVGGGRPGIGQQAFRQYYRDQEWREIISPDGTERHAVALGPIGEPNLPIMLAEYVHAVARFKEHATSLRP